MPGTYVLQSHGFGGGSYTLTREEVERLVGEAVDGDFTLSNSVTRKSVRLNNGRVLRQADVDRISNEPGAAGGPGDTPHDDERAEGSAELAEAAAEQAADAADEAVELAAEIEEAIGEAEDAIPADTPPEARRVLLDELEALADWAEDQAEVAEQAAEVAEDAAEDAEEAAAEGDRDEAEAAAELAEAAASVAVEAVPDEPPMPAGFARKWFGDAAFGGGD